MGDADATQDNVTEENSEEQQSVTAEQIEDLKKQLEETKKAQSGSDRMVQELRHKLEQAEQEKANVEKTTEEKFAERFAELEKKVQQTEKEKAYERQKNVAIEMLANEGLKAPKYLNRLIGANDEETSELIEAYIEEKKADSMNANAEFAKKHGRKVDDGKPNYKTINDYSAAEIKAMSDEEFEKVMARSK